MFDTYSTIMPLYSFSPTNDGIFSDIRVGRSHDQYIAFHGFTRANFLTSMSPISNPKNFIVSVRSGTPAVDANTVIREFVFKTNGSLTIPALTADNVSPFTISSNILVQNLNAEFLGGMNKNQFAHADGTHATGTWDINITGTAGGGGGGAGDGLPLTGGTLTGLLKIDITSPTAIALGIGTAANSNLLQFKSSTSGATINQNHSSSIKLQILEDTGVELNSSGDFLCYGRLTTTGDQSRSSWAYTGPAFASQQATYTDTSSIENASVNIRPINSFLQPTLDSTNNITVVNAATVYISNAPKENTVDGKTSITNSYALFVDNGLSYFGGNVVLNSTPTDKKHAITKDYVDSKSSKDTCRAATTAPLYGVTYSDNKFTFGGTPILVGDVVDNKVVLNNHGFKNSQAIIFKPANTGLMINGTEVETQNTNVVYVIEDTLNTFKVAINHADSLSRTATTISAAAVTINIQIPCNIDGCGLSVGERVLVKNQVDSSKNGIYTVTDNAIHSWELTRSDDFDSWGDLLGAIIPVFGAGSNNDTVWMCTNPRSGIFDTEPVSLRNIFSNAIQTKNRYDDVTFSIYPIWTDANPINPYTALLCNVNIINDNPNNLLFNFEVENQTKCSLTPTGILNIANHLYCKSSNTDIPTLITRSAGTRIVLHDSLTSDYVDHAIGVDAYTQWYSIPSETSRCFKWFAGVSMISMLHSGGMQFNKQSDPYVKSPAVTGTLAISSLLQRIIQCTPSSNITLTLPSGISIDNAFALMLKDTEFDIAFDWTIMNTAVTGDINTNVISVAANSTGHDFEGFVKIYANSSARFRTRRDALGSWITYRIG